VERNAAMYAGLRAPAIAKLVQSCPLPAALSSPGRDRGVGLLHPIQHKETIAAEDVGAGEVSPVGLVQFGQSIGETSLGYRELGVRN